MLFSKQASQLTVSAHSSLHAMANYEQKYLHKEAICLLYVQLYIQMKTPSSKQHVKCTFIPSFKFMAFNSILN